MCGSNPTPKIAEPRPGIQRSKRHSIPIASSSHEEFVLDHVLDRFCR